MVRLEERTVLAHIKCVGSGPPPTTEMLHLPQGKGIQRSWAGNLALLCLVRQVEKWDLWVTLRLHGAGSFSPALLSLFLLFSHFVPSPPVWVGGTEVAARLEELGYCDCVS